MGTKKGRKFYTNTASFWMAKIGLVMSAAVFSTIVAMSILGTNFPGANPFQQYAGILGKVWFENLQYFTILGNLLVFAYFITFFVGHKTKAFADNRFMLYTASYIGCVGIMYWGILVPTQGMPAKDDIITWFNHAAIPGYFLIYTLVAISDNRKHFNKSALNVKYIKFLALGLIFPAWYISYVVSINFIPVPDSVFNAANDLMSATPGSAGVNYVTVYGSITNFNHNCLNKITGADGRITYNTDSRGSLMNIALVSGILLMIPGFQAILVVINNAISKRR